LKAGVWFRRVRFVIWSPDPRPISPSSGRKSTYRPVQILEPSSVIAKMSELRRKGVPHSDLKIIASDPDLAAITKDVEALNDA
jgi:hypothetical protein